MNKLILIVFVSLISVTLGISQTVPPKTAAEKPERVAAGPRRTDANTTPFRILSKTPARYTDEARENSIEGTVRLKVTFLASGNIGTITPVMELPFGLTEQAITAARDIRFTPKIVNVVAISVVQQVWYTFSLYYDEDAKEITEKAKISEMPEIEFPAGGLFDDIEGKLPVTIILHGDGRASLKTIHSTVSKDIEQMVRDAVSKIVFEPAKTADGKSVIVTRKVIYELKRKS